uniref:NADH-ubiquinone oxidoreductase chain 5 n=1 Tax=Corallianassa coutierei TaxID=1267413 RepID=L0E8S9_CORCW|nr:NADH dehydrogenase subunit 5 [Corallianassa coutierei]AGA56161.1 NADH dehydrogenase subunit 5 [Corallianassa coutierei]
MTWKFSLNSTSMFFLSMSALSLLPMSLLSLLLDIKLLVEWELSFINSSMIEFVFFLDWMSIMFLSFVCFISAMVLFYSGDYMLGDPNINRFIYLVLAFVFSMSMMICSPNLISILLGWDGLGLISYVLVIYYQNEKSANAGMITILSNRVGDVAILMSIGLFLSLGSWNFPLYAPNMSDEMVLIKLLVILAACTKSAQMPFSAWLPAAMAAPTPVSALVHSSTLVTAGVYLLIRFSPALENSLSQPPLLLISALTMFMAGLGANFEYDLKKIIALSTLSQLGVMISVLALGFPVLAFFHLLTHAMFKALLFLCAGVVIHNVKEYQDIRIMGSLTKSLPLTLMCLNTANLALCGMPFLAGFYSKDLILETAFSNNINLIAFILFAAATGLTVAYSFRLTFMSLTKSFSMPPLSNSSDKSITMTTPMLVLSLGALSSGTLLSWIIFPEPILISLPMLLKTLPLQVSLLGLLTGYLLNITKVNYPLQSLSMLLPTHFSGSMWFMPFLSSFPTAFMSLKTGNSYQVSLDKGWSEFFGSQGIFNNAIALSKNIQSAQNANFSLFLATLVMWSAICLLLI